LAPRGGPQVDVCFGKGIQFAQIYYIKLGIHSFYVLPYQPEEGTASRDNFSGTDGTSVPNGTIKDIMNGSGDVVLTCLTIMYNRYLVIDYLVPLDRYPVGIYVSKDSIQESFDFEFFSAPFDK
jgi:hypothetical protein